MLKGILVAHHKQHWYHVCSSWATFPRISAKISALLGLSPFFDSSVSISSKTAAFSPSGASLGNLSQSSLVVSCSFSAVRSLNGSFWSLIFPAAGYSKIPTSKNNFWWLSLILQTKQIVIVASHLKLIFFD